MVKINNSMERIPQQLEKYLKSIQENELMIKAFPIFLPLLDNILTDFSFMKNLDEKINYPLTQIDLKQKIILLNHFYNYLNIDFNINKYIKNGIICFGKEAKYLFNGEKQYILVPNNNLVIDIPVMVHEFSHFMDYKNGIITSEKDAFTETFAYSYELINLAYLYDNNYINDSLFYAYRLFNYFYNFAKQYQPLFKMITFYEMFNNFPKKEYISYFKDHNYENHIRYLNFISTKNVDIIKCCQYILGICISIYTFQEYINGNITIDKIKQFQKSVNNLNADECLNIIGLNYLTVQDTEILLKSLSNIGPTVNKKAKVYYL